MNTTIKNVILVMFEKTMMPDSMYSEEQKKYVKTGNKTERTTYTFRDEFGTKLVFLAGNEYRALERESVDLDIELSFDDYNRKNKISLKNVRKSENKK